jgi:hypothetical protein
MSWPQLIFGWPAIISALGAFGLAFVGPRSFLGFGGVALAAPFLLFASLAPGGLWFSPALFLALAAAAELLRRGRHVGAAACLAPFVFIVTILALTVVAYR